MERSISRIVVLILFILMIIVTFTFFVYHGWAEYSIEGDQLTDREWLFLRWGFGLIVGELVAFMIALRKDYFGLMDNERARQQARLHAHQITVESAGNHNKLKKLYIEYRKQLKTQYRDVLEETSSWTNDLLREFARETHRQAQEAADWDNRYQGLKHFTLPSDKEIDDFQVVSPLNKEMTGKVQPN